MNDDDIRDRLHAADPARSLTPYDEPALTKLLEDTVNQPVNQSLNETAPGRGRVYLLAGAAAAMVAIAVGVGIAVGSGDDERSKEANPGTGTSVTALTAGPAAAAKCRVPSPEMVASQEVAFEATVLSVRDGVVTLDPSKFFAGPETDRVTVDQPDLGMSERPVDFQVGEDYLVAATEGSVSICGLSGPATDDLRALYEAAFPGR